jgi:hypothetical protein
MDGDEKSSLKRPIEHPLPLSAESIHKQLLRIMANPSFRATEAQRMVQIM